jgi:hypothetical protein
MIDCPRVIHLMQYQAGDIIWHMGSKPLDDIYFTRITYLKGQKLIHRSLPVHLEL